MHILAATSGRRVKGVRHNLHPSRTVQVQSTTLRSVFSTSNISAYHVVIVGRHYQMFLSTSMIFWCLVVRRRNICVSAGMKLKLSKCFFLLLSVEYLGHVISTEGIRPLAEKTRAISNAPAPQNITELRSFLEST